MKTIIKTALTAIKRAAAHYRMRSIEINLAGAVETLQHVNDPLTRERMRLAIRERISMSRVTSADLVTMVSGWRVSASTSTCSTWPGSRSRSTDRDA